MFSQVVSIPWYRWYCVHRIVPFSCTCISNFQIHVPSNRLLFGTKARGEILLRQRWPGPSHQRLLRVDPHHRTSERCPLVPQALPLAHWESLAVFVLLNCRCIHAENDNGKGCAIALLYHLVESGLVPINCYVWILSVHCLLAYPLMYPCHESKNEDHKL